MTSLASFPWLPFLGGFLLAVAISYGLGRYLGPRGWMDVPTGRRQHERPTPRTGGLALLVALAILALCGRKGLGLRPLQAAAVGGLGLLGLWDDRFGLRARLKALPSLAIAVMLATELALRLLQQGGPLRLAGFPVPNHLALTIPLLTLWFWSIPQALNLSDGIDGLAAGISALALAAAGLIPWAAPGFWGVLVGVLLLNFPKPFHFLGDCGSLALGGIVAIKVMEASLVQDASLSLWICAYLIVDVTAVVLGRLRAGLPLGCGDRGHLHYLVKDTFGSARFATPILLLIAGAPMLRATGSQSLASMARLGLTVLLVLGLVVVARYRRPTRELDSHKGESEGLWGRGQGF